MRKDGEDSKDAIEKVAQDFKEKMNYHKLTQSHIHANNATTAVVQNYLTSLVSQVADARDQAMQREVNNVLGQNIRSCAARIEENARIVNVNRDILERSVILHQSKLSDHSTQIETLADKAVKGDADRNTIEKSVSSLENQLRERTDVLTAEHSTTKASLDTATKSIEEFKSLYTEATGNLEKSLKEHTESLTKLQTVVDTCQQESRERADKLTTELQAEKEKSVETHKTYRAQMDELGTKHAELEESMTKFNTDATAAREKHSTLLETLQKTQSVMETKVDATVASCTKFDATVTELSKTAETTKEAVTKSLEALDSKVAKCITDLERQAKASKELHEKIDKTSHD